MEKRLKKIAESQKGEGYVDVIVLVLSAVMVLALSMRVLPVFIQKQQTCWNGNKPPCSHLDGKNRTSPGYFMVS